METEGYLPPGEAAERTPVPAAVMPATDRQPPESYVVEAVKREFLADPAFGRTRPERAHRLFAGGLTIATTIDPGLQAAAAEAADANLRGDAGPAAAIAVVEPASGRVRALHSGTEFAGEQFDVATQGHRQPGSALKPFVLAAAVEQQGRMPRDLPGDSPETSDGPGLVEPWEVANFRDTDHGTVDGNEALVRSVNTAFADLILDVGVEEVAELVGRVGIDVDAALRPPDTRGPSIALGGLTHGVSPLELASAYATFANDGIHVRPHLIARVTDADGADVLVQGPHAVRALDTDTNEVVVEALHGALRHGDPGTADRLAADRQDRDHPGQRRRLVRRCGARTVVGGVGRPSRRAPAHSRTHRGSLPARIWRDLMDAALEGIGPLEFAAS